MTAIDDFRFPSLAEEHHRACGIVKGCVTQFDSESKRAWLVCPNGESFEARVINPGAEKFANRGWQTFMVYPAFENGLILQLAYPRKDEARDRYFEIQGVITGIYRRGKIAICIWSRSENKLLLVKVNGYLPAQCGQVWWLQCELDTDGLYIVDGRKIAAQWTPPEGFDQLRTFKVIKKRSTREKARRILSSV